MDQIIKSNINYSLSYYFVPKIFLMDQIKVIFLLALFMNANTYINFTHKKINEK